MTKIYFNFFNNKGILINEKDKTFKMVSKKDIQNKECFFYQVSLRRIVEVRNGLLQRSFTRA